jgi:cytoskeleton protein RodZ
MSEVAQALGQRLKAERERRGVSAQKMADDMHLDAWVIEALEAGDYQRIGPPVYARGHLKHYAASLGLSAAEISAGYDAKPTPPAVAVSQLPGLRMHAVTPATSNLQWSRLAGFAALALLAGGVFWWRPWHQRSGPAPAAATVARSSESAPSSSEAAKSAADAAQSAADAAQSPADAAVASSPAPAVADTAAASSAPNAGDNAEAAAANAARSTSPSPRPSAAPRAVAGAPAIAPAAEAPAAIPAVLSKSATAPSEGDLTPGVGRALLRLSFSADSWVDVHDYSGQRVFAGRGRANSVKTITGIAPFRVYLGFASGVQLQVNDRAVAIGPQFVSGDVARFEAGADGVLRRDSHPSSDAPTGAAAPRG